MEKKCVTSSCKMNLMVGPREIKITEYDTLLGNRLKSLAPHQIWSVSWAEKNEAVKLNLDYQNITLE